MVFLGFFLFFCFFLCFCAEFHLRIDESLTSLILFLIRSIRLKQMCLYIVAEFQIQDVLDLFLDLLILYREHDLDTTVQISRHPVRTSHIDLLSSAILEVKDPAVFQKFSDDGAHMNVFAHSRDSHFHTADASYQKIDLYTAGRSMIKS